MNKLVQETADRALNRAISADEQSNARYYQILRRFITTKSAFPEEKTRQPDASLDAGGLKEIDVAWQKLQITQKKLRSAFMKLYVAYI